MRTHLAPALVLLGLAASPAAAHDVWIEPSVFTPSPGQGVVVRLRMGHGPDQIEPVPRPEHRMRRFALVTASGETPIPGREGQDPAGFFRAPDWEFGAIVYHTAPLVHRLSPERFERVLEEEGLTARVHALRETRGAVRESASSDATIGERYGRSLKSLLGVGWANAPGVDRPFGLPLELVAHRLATTASPCSSLDVQLLFKGAPLAGGLIKAHNLDDWTSAEPVRTDAEGHASLALPRAGRWLLTAVNMIPATDDAAVSWESFWTSLTFELPGQGLAGALPAGGDNSLIPAPPALR